MSRRAGFSLIELIVVIAIVGLLASLLFVAIQQSRVRASATVCKRNLANLALASLNYESAREMMPDEAWQARILPFLEAEADKNSASHIGSYVCPSETYFSGYEDQVYGSYLGCSGIWPTGKNFRFDGVFKMNGDGRKEDGIAIASIVDGASNTALYSEALFPMGNKSRLRTIWNSKERYSGSDLDGFVNEIKSMPNDPTQNGWKDNDYSKGVLFVIIEDRKVPHVGVGSNLYNHALSPGYPMAFNRTSVTSAIAPPSSGHQTVSVAFVDGHARDISPTIELAVWRAFGTCNDKDHR